jgi:hypothetical protein
VIADREPAAKLVHVAREAVDLIAGELAEAEAALRIAGELTPESADRHARALSRLAQVLRHAGEQFKAAGEAIGALIVRRPAPRIFVRARARDDDARMSARCDDTVLAHARDVSPAPSCWRSASSSTRRSP